MRILIVKCYYLMSSYLDQPILPNPVIEAYKKDIDRTLLRENLKLTPEQRVQKFIDMQLMAEELKKAGQQLRSQ